MCFYRNLLQGYALSRVQPLEQPAPATRLTRLHKFIQSMLQFTASAVSISFRSSHINCIGFTSSEAAHLAAVVVSDDVTLFFVVVLC
jgi:hypothetical protein